jgi:hypothetical protein
LIAWTGMPFLAGLAGMRAVFKTYIVQWLSTFRHRRRNLRRCTVPRVRNCRPCLWPWRSGPSRRGTSARCRRTCSFSRTSTRVRRRRSRNRGSRWPWRPRRRRRRRCRKRRSRRSRRLSRSWRSCSRPTFRRDRSWRARWMPWQGGVLRGLR